MTFRLALNQFERFFYLDDVAGYPNTIICRLRFEGTFDRELIDQAAKFTVDRHQITGSKIARNRFGKLEWVRTQGEYPRVFWRKKEECLDYPLIDHLDLQHENGTRLYFVEGEGATDLVIQTHHACCDGLGGMQCIADFLVTYHNLATGNRLAKDLRRLDEDLYRLRAKFYPRGWAFLKALPFQPIGLFGAYKYFFQKAVPLKGVSESPARGELKADAKYQPHGKTLQLTEQETRQLKSIARRENSSTNNLLARDLLLAVSRFRNEIGEGRLEDRLRILVPFNLRDFRDRRLPAANRVSMVYLDRTMKECRDRNGLLWSLNFEMRAIQKWGLAPTFTWMLRLINSVPGWMPAMVRDKRCRASFLFTNMADFFQRVPLPQEGSDLKVGSLNLKSIDLLAPIRPLTQAAFTAFELANRQNITLHYDRAALSQEESDRILELFSVAVRETLDTVEKPKKS